MDGCRLFGTLTRLARNKVSHFVVVLKHSTRRQKGIAVTFRKQTIQFIRALALPCLLVFAAWCPAQELVTTTVFQSGTEGYNTFRIPAIVRTPGRLLAFCEGRLSGGSDSGEIDIVLKSSEDGGAAWSPLSVVLHDPGFTCGNPSPVYESKSGQIVLLWTKNPASAMEARILTGEDPPRTVWVSRSSDEGATWSAPEDLSATASRPGWRWYATGPGHAIQLQSGRLLVPANHSLGPDREGWRSHVIFSDDRGKTWTIGGVHQGYTNESAVAELSDGRVYQNMRSYTGENRRRVSYSDDGGLTWTGDQTDPALIESVCQASVLSAGSGLLFANPASLKREKMTLRWSGDGGKTWPAALKLYAGPSAYSDLVLMNESIAACVYERGGKNPYETIVFSPIPLSRLAPVSVR